MRNLLIFVLVLFAIWWIRRAIGRSRDASAQGDRGVRRREQGGIEHMVGCAHCGVHVPESEGVRDGNAFYCCEEHRRLGARR